MPLNIDWQQILLHAFNLVLLFTIFYLLLYKPVKKFMDDRQKYYKDLDEKAKTSIENGNEVKEEYTKRLENADNEIKEIRENARKEAENSSEKIISDAKEEAERILSEAKTNALREHDRIIADANEEISQIVTEATSKIVFSDTEKAYDSFLKEVEGSGKSGK